MRAICAVAVALLVSLVGSLAAAQQEASPQDTALAAAQQDANPQDIALAEALWRIAVLTHTRIGFQSIGRARHIRLNKIPNPELLDVSHAVDAVVRVDRRYEWHLVGETAVIRPREAWTDPADPLNRRVPPAQLKNETTGDVFFRLSNLIFYNQFTPPEHPGLGIPVSFQMNAGTVVDALNQLAEQAGQVMWVAWARPRDNPNGWDVCTNIGSCHADLEFELRDAEHYNGGLSAQPQPGMPKKR
jgi:hypothetical protein